MKRIALSLFASSVLFAAAPALADHPFPPDCHLEGINRSLDEAINQIHSSPAWGHAGGHYAKAERDLQNVTKNLHEGCRAFNGRDW
jgi:hypothetical protein